ncbi:metabolite traffic protein EboE [Rhizomonospora bruguierae]|uniref:metabolite traffic protein EboE n=1 Tax=Rhizomonospora bruguierae TaxID=1581705 RepID=UPI001BD0EF90|nr:metabolite traffic protein EboE [Micromonospora sp. NBRC 107566]
MRLRHPDGQTVHLGYCTNVHPAEDLTGILAQLDATAVPARERLDADVLGLGLWLPAPLAAGLAASSTRRAKLRRELAVRGLEVVTLNGSPYRGFQTDGAKAEAYRPDWTSPRRLEYTLDLARVLADLLPDDAVRGSVSTMPLGWREPWGAAEDAAVRRQLDDLTKGLGDVVWQTGRAVRVGFEPGPGCVVETTAQAVAHLTQVDTDVIGVCLDLAHLACAWERPEDALRRVLEAGLPVVAVQLSAAIEVAEPGTAAATLAGFAEPRFLHHVRGPAGPVADDLPAALAQADAATGGPWRVHFHVPLHATLPAPLTTTTPVLREGLAALLGRGAAGCDHLVVDTYTWNVLPGQFRPAGPGALARGIAEELRYAREELVSLGLTPVDRSAVEIP